MHYSHTSHYSHNSYDSIIPYHALNRYFSNVHSDATPSPQ